tara:strand:+ start:179 stop:877 length:699 start_codon:yes stop_codon:yes gene_type:complete
MTLVVAPCSHEAAKWAVEHWHYSQRMPSGKLARFGAWEDDRYIGAVIFGSGANQHMLRPYGLDQIEGCELVRVALRDHESPTTQILASAIRSLKMTNPGLRLLVSYADTAQNHYGGIYQAGNWIYLGEYVGTHGVYRINGQPVHGRSVNARYGTKRIDWLRANVDPEATPMLEPPKHRYVFPLDHRMRKQVAPLALPYPHADEDSRGSRLGSTEEGRVRSPASAPTVSRVRA